MTGAHRRDKLFDRVFGPFVAWAFSRMPRWAALILAVPAGVVLAVAVSVPGMFRPWDLEVLTGSGRVTVRWAEYRSWPPGLDSWQHEIGKLRNGATTRS